MTRLGHTVYVVTIDFPTIVDIALEPHGAVRPALPADIGIERLGVVKDGRILSLSSAEVEELRAFAANTRSF